MGNTCLTCTSMGNEIETAVSFREKTEPAVKDATTPDYIITTCTKSSRQISIKMGPIYKKLKLKSQTKI